MLHKTSTISLAFSALLSVGALFVYWRCAPSRAASADSTPRLQHYVSASRRCCRFDVAACSCKLPSISRGSAARFSTAFVRRFLRISSSSAAILLAMRDTHIVFTFISARWRSRQFLWRSSIRCSRPARRLRPRRRRRFFRRRRPKLPTRSGRTLAATSAVPSSRCSSYARSNF